jgi:uncharacterized membrane protein YeaQ/YmgE (transglycosylase-associated protein family)
MSIGSIIIFLIVGAVAGWLAGLVVTGRGFGLVGDIIIGVVGALIGGWLLPRLGIHISAGINNVEIGQFIEAFIGAVILLIILRLVRR